MDDSELATYDMVNIREWVDAVRAHNQPGRPGEWAGTHFFASRPKLYETLAELEKDFNPRSKLHV